MEVIRTISLYAGPKSVPFILIGGHAIHFYGLSRQTGDLDFLVRLSDREWWQELMERFRYKAGQSDDRFARFSPPELAMWPIDFMYVDDQTFDKIYKDSVDGVVGIAELKIISADHLVALKIHALKHYQEHRFVKDYNDLVWLLRSEKTGITEDELKTLCEKYASTELYDKIIADGVKL